MRSGIGILAAVVDEVDAVDLEHDASDTEGTELLDGLDGLSGDECRFRDDPFGHLADLDVDAEQHHITSRSGLATWHSGHSLASCSTIVPQGLWMRLASMP